MEGVVDKDSAALDLTNRKRVGSRETPSPYNSSGYGDGSPSTNDSPSRANASLIRPNLSFENFDLNSYYLLQQKMLNGAFNPFQKLVEPPITHPVESQSPELDSDNKSLGGLYDTISPLFPISRDGKMARPFKAYPQNSLSVTPTVTSLQLNFDADINRRFLEYSHRAFERLQESNGGSIIKSNPKMRRVSGKSNQSVVQEPSEADKSSDESSKTGESSDQLKDAAYFERRKKNNAAAKKSRDRRRVKEDQIAIRASFLEQEVLRLQFEVAHLKEQLRKYEA